MFTVKKTGKLAPVTVVLYFFDITSAEKVLPTRNT